MSQNRLAGLLALLTFGCSAPLLQSTEQICEGQCIGYSSTSGQFACGRFQSDTAGGYPKSMCALELISPVVHRTHLIQMDTGYQGAGAELAQSPVASLESLSKILAGAGFDGQLPPATPVKMNQTRETGWKGTRMSVNAASGSGYDGVSKTYKLLVHCPDGSKRTEELLPEGDVTFSVQNSPAAHVIALTTTANESEEGRAVHSVRTHVFNLRQLCDK